MVVIHYTAMATAAAARARLCDPSAEVSAHWLIDAQGGVEALVAEDLRAWHAGAGAWGGVSDVNSRSIGIELANDGTTPFAARQIAALEDVLAGAMARWSIRPERGIRHSDLAPDRKADPGPRFDWRRLTALATPKSITRATPSTSFWPEPAPPGDFAADAAAFGWRAGHPDLVLRAFRLRFRPWAAGPQDATDAALAAGLRAWPGPEA
ncbi:MAG TPA: N-acetylmuramoyl-L-alanine amidase [Paracoccaceae bacterium]|nr:N-acetylmuramoyl-L-alanine amidase [Paracoccaceae bacterium]